MEVSNSKNNQYVSMRYVLSNVNETQTATVTRSEHQETVKLRQADGEVITYDLKKIYQNSNHSSVNENQTDKVQLGANHSWRNEQMVTSYIDMSKPTHEIRYEYGNFNTTDKIDEFLKVSDRLLPLQQEKIKYITPSQDWLDLASKLDDEQLNQLTDIVYDMSESIFLNGGGSRKVEEIVSQFNTLSSNALADTIDTMFQLREKATSHRLSTAKASANVDKYAYRNISESGLFSRVNPLGLEIEEGDALLDYTKLIFSANEYSDKELSAINDTITDVSYLAARGVIDAVNLVEGESKDKLFSMLSSNDTTKINDIFSYFGNLTTKTSFTSSYQVDYESGQQDFAKVLNRPFSESEQKQLIENILSVEDETNIDSVLNIINKTAFSADNIQAGIWESVAEDVITSQLPLSNEHISALVEAAESSFISRQADKVYNDFALSLQLSERKITRFSLLDHQAKYI